MGMSSRHHNRSTYQHHHPSSHHRISSKRSTSSNRRRHPASSPPSSSRRESVSSNPALLQRRASLLDYRHRNSNRQNGSSTTVRSDPSRRRSSPDSSTLPTNSNRHHLMNNESLSNSSRADESDLRSQISKGRRLSASTNCYYSSNDEDMNLEKELFPLGHYINDRSEMIEQIFSIIKGQKLNAMLTSNLRDLSPQELKENCLIQLEGMSKQRIRCILAGQEMEESSNTEEEEEEEEEDDHHSSNHQDELCNKSVHVDENPVDGNVHFDVFDDDEEDYKKVVEKDDKMAHDKSHNVKDKVTATKVFSLSKKKMDDGTDEVKREQEYEKVLSDRSSKMIYTTLKKIDVNISKKSKSLMEEEGVSPLPPHPPPPPQGEQSKMELLELEMRARAIKALLGKNEKSGEIKINLTSEEHLQENEDAKKIRKEESLKRRKAREVLELSEAKKRDEEEKRELKQKEMLERIEEHGREMKEKEAEETKKKKEEEERLLAKKKKEEEHAKFLKWKEEKLLREEELKRQNKLNDEGKIKHCVKRNLDNLRRRDEDTLASRKRSPSEKLVKRGHDKNKYRKKNVHTSSDEEQDNERSRKHHEPPSNRSEQHPQKEEEEEDAHSPVSSDEEELFLRERRTRAERVAEIRRRKRKVKRASDIEDGEVDTDGENFEPLSNKKSDKRSQKRSRKCAKKGHVYIADDSDKEKVVSSSENEYVNEKRGTSSKKGQFKKESTSKKLADRESEDTKDSEPELEIVKETEDERKVREEWEKQENKRLERMEKLQKDRLKRMQAFQQRTEIQEQTSSTDGEDVEKGDDTSKVEKVVFSSTKSGKNRFYQSYIEEEERKKDIEDSVGEDKLVTDAGAAASLQLATPRPPPPAKKPLARIDGLAEVAKLCETQGDFESQPHSPPMSKKENESDTTMDSSEKSRVDKEQEELENQTWADRWYQDKTVQKVVKESKTYSKVRNNIKMKIDSKKDPPKELDPERLNEVAAQLPDVSTMGSIQQYAKITGKTLEDIDKSRVDPENPTLSDADDEISLGGGDEDLWGDIMGTNNE